MSFGISAPAVLAAVLGLTACGSASSSPSVTASPAIAPASTAGPPSASTNSAPVAFADCATAHFGSPLAPLDPPADVHVYSAPPKMTIAVSKLYLATMTTARGVITLCLQPELAPVTVNNFVTLARNHFFDGLVFHRVVAGFVVQGGDPKGNGSGGPGYSFADEPVRQQYVLGAVAMANSGPDTNGSQFFIDIADDRQQLQPNYNLFGKVGSGQDVAGQIQQGDAMTTVTVAQQQ